MTTLNALRQDGGQKIRHLFAASREPWCVATSRGPRFTPYITAHDTHKWGFMWDRS